MNHYVDHDEEEWMQIPVSLLSVLSPHPPPSITIIIGIPFFFFPASTDLYSPRVSH